MSIITSAIYDFPSDFEILAAAVLNCISYFAPGIVECGDPVSTPGRLQLTLWQEQLGELGSVVISKIPAGRSEVFFKFNSLGNNQRELENRERRKKHFGEVIAGILLRLREAGIYAPVTRAARGKPGRPTLPDDEWAVNQLKSGRERRDVEQEWSGRDGVKQRHLVDPHAQFNRLVRRAKTL